ncbi:MAG: PorV/PorQ family protein [bacterium]
MKKARNFKAVMGTLLIGALLPCALLAQNEPTVLGGPSKTGTVGAQFLQIGVSARATGMGESFVALVNDASAAFYNPAALTEVGGREAMFNHTNLPGGLAHFYAAYVQPVSGFGTVAISFNMLTTGDMPITVAFEGATGETFSASESAIAVSYAKQLTDRFSVGGTGKLILEDLAGFDERTVAFDVGTLYHTGFRDLTIGMAVSNFGPDLNFGTEKDSGGNVIFEGQNFPLPITFKFGIALDVVNRSTSKLILASNLVQPNDNLRYETVGFEYSWQDALFLRGGFKIDEEDDEDNAGDTNGFSERFSAGAGIKARLSDFTGKFDVSWVSQDNLDDLIRFSVLLNF